MVAAFIIILMIAMQVGDRKYRSLTRELSQWDGQHYLSIARDGYEKYPCSWNPAYVCGNIGWFPFYPIVGSIVMLTGIDPGWSMVIVSWLSFWVAILILFRLIESLFNQRTAIFSTVALLLFPTSFYYATVFPYSVYLLLASTVFYLLHRRRYTWLFLSTAFLTVTYPSGAIIGLPIAYVLLRNWRNHSYVDRIKLGAALVSIGVAMLLYFTYYYFEFNDFFLYLTYQRQSFYGHEVSFPLITFYKALTMLPANNPEFLIVALTIAATILTYSRKIAVEWQLFMFAVLLFTPTFGTTQCYYRHIVVAFPLFVMIGLGIENRWRKYLFAAYAIASLVLMWSVYLPTFKKTLLM